FLLFVLCFLLFLLFLVLLGRGWSPRPAWARAASRRLGSRLSRGECFAARRLRQLTRDHVLQDAERNLDRLRLLALLAVHFQLELHPRQPMVEHGRQFIAPGERPPPVLIFTNFYNAVSGFEPGGFRGTVGEDIAHLLAQFGVIADR